MNFYFQSGEFLSSGGASAFELFVQFTAIVVGAFVSILVFQMGKWHNDDNEIDRLNGLEIYIKSALTGLITAMNKQRESLEIFVKDLDDKAYKTYSVSKIVSLHAGSIRWISYNDLYKIFVVNKKINTEANLDLFNTFNADLDYVDSIEPSLDAIMNLLNKHRNESVDRFNLNLTSLNELKDRIGAEYRRQNSIKQTAYPFFEETDATFLKWTHTKDFKEHVNVVSHLLLPLQEICRKHPSDGNAVSVIYYVNECLYAYDEIDNIKSTTQDSIKHVLAKVKSIDENFSKIFKQLGEGYLVQGFSVLRMFRLKKY